jgi:hypothetical protein
MGVKHRLGKNINYSCLKTKCRKILGSKEDEVGQIRVLHNMDLSDLQNTEYY